ncbi:hypothetical protein HMPREF1868_00267 [Olsenella sp. DNF00959]|nr:hypothetical protein HMPREF1868_00267 [Olsenella sp. DNF00959]
MLWSRDVRERDGPRPHCTRGPGRRRKGRGAWDRILDDVRRASQLLENVQHVQGIRELASRGSRLDALDATGQK